MNVKKRTDETFYANLTVLKRVSRKMQWLFLPRKLTKENFTWVIIQT